MAIYIDKLKVNDSKNEITINYTEKRDNITDVMTLKSNELAAPELYDALNAFNGHIGKIFGCEINRDTEVKVHTITFKRDSIYRIDDIILSLEWDCLGGTVNVNTPEMSYTSFYGETLNAEQAAINYLKGKRAQMSLFDDEADGKDANDNEEEDDDDDDVESDAYNEADGFAAANF